MILLFTYFYASIRPSIVNAVSPCLPIFAIQSYDNIIMLITLLHMSN